MRVPPNKKVKSKNKFKLMKKLPKKKKFKIIK